jgi:aryl-alcohol dehydrogenase-like predicted oxidoreductase
MRYRQLGASGLRVSVLTMGTMTFGGTEEQLADNLGAAGLSLTPEELARLEEVSRPPLLYPYWHQAKTAADRLGPADLALLGPHLAG